MTNYNDGKWHGWNGGECPVHTETVVECVYYGGGPVVKEHASYFSWVAIIAFRVIKEYKEPREFWIQGGKVYEDVPPTCYRSETIHVREVLE